MQTQTTPATANMVTIVNRQGETVRVGGGRVLVASETRKGVWYDVTNGKCQCKGYEYRRTCRHLRAAPERPEPPTPSAPASCPRCQRATTERDASAIAKLSQCARCANELLYGAEEVA